jgi:exosome complex component RRP41
VGLTAASLALADAGIPMKDLVACCAAGRINGEIALDLQKDEDNYGEADVPVGILPRTKDVVLLQMDGKLTRPEFSKALGMAVEGCMKVYELQKQALLRSVNNTESEVL